MPRTSAVFPPWDSFRISNLNPTKADFELHRAACGGAEALYHCPGRLVGSDSFGTYATISKICTGIYLRQLEEVIISVPVA
jgi:lipoate-protein ligase B